MAEEEKKEKHKLIGELLLESGQISEVQLAVALGKQRNFGGKLGIHLLKLGYVAEQTLANILKEQMGITWVSLKNRKIPAEAIRAVPLDIALKHTVIPIEIEDKTITVATPNPSNLAAMDEIAFRTGKKVKPVMALDWDIARAIAGHYRSDDETMMNEFLDRYDPVKGSDEVRIEDFIHVPSIEIDPQGAGSPDFVLERGPLDAAAEGKHKNAPPGHHPRDRRSLIQEALISILVRKGIITREQLLDEIIKLENAERD